MKSARFFLPIALIPLLVAQNASQVFQNAPPHIDEALRARVAIFYQSHVDGKARLADAVVHEDSKDTFFEAQKPRYKSYEIVIIKYLENYTRAQVVAAVEGDFMMIGHGTQQFKVPITTLWKLDGGEWWWYVPSAADGVATPFGTMKSGPDAEAKAAVYATLRSMPTATDIQSQVKVNKSEVLLKAYEPSTDQVQIINMMPGPVSLTITNEGPLSSGYQVSLDTEELAPNEKATVTFRIDPINKYPKATVKANIRVQPSNAVIPIVVRFESEPGTDPKLLPTR